jgi:uncharacterized protein
MDPLQTKADALLANLSRRGSLIVAYSGGVDSSYLAYAAHRALGERSLAVTAESPSYPRSHRRMAEEVVQRFGIPHRFVKTHEMDSPDYVRNPGNRCYFCKSELFDVLEGLRRELDYDAVTYGLNTDDTHDFRPGQLAAEEHRVLSPLLEVGLSKREIRELSREAGLPTAELPASACLSCGTTAIWRGSSSPRKSCRALSIRSGCGACRARCTRSGFAGSASTWTAIAPAR